jgi:hypothetical protein
MPDGSPSTPSTRGSAARWLLVGSRVYDLERLQSLDPSALPIIGESERAMVQGDVLFVAGGDGTVTAAELPSGMVRWRAAAGRPCTRLLDGGSGPILCVGESAVDALGTSDGARRPLFSSPGLSIRYAEAVADGVVVLLSDRTFRLLRVSTGTTVGQIAQAPADTDGVSQSPLVVGRAREVFCTIARRQTHFSIACYAADDGRRLWASEALEHTAVRVEGNVHTSEPYLYYRSVGREHLLFGTISWGPPRRAVVLGLRDGHEAARVDEQVVAMVESGDGRLLGLVAVAGDDQGEAISYLSPDGRTRRWSVPNLAGHDGAAAALSGDRLVLATYPMIATGSALRCVDASTGTELWTGDVVQLEIGHSQYWNEVELLLTGTDVATIGREAGGSYLQVFDLATGARRFASQ